MNLRLDAWVRGDDEAAGRLRRLAASAEHAGAFFDEARGILVDETRARWMRSRWPDLDPDTKRIKSKAGLDPRILRAKGTLERALTRERAPGQLYEVRLTQMRWGLDQQGVAYYGYFHHAGRSVPRRPIVGVTPTARRRLRDALARHLVGLGSSRGRLASLLRR